MERFKVYYKQKFALCKVGFSCWRKIKRLTMLGGGGICGLNLNKRGTMLSKKDRKRIQYEITRAEKRQDQIGRQDPEWNKLQSFIDQMKHKLEAK